MRIHGARQQREAIKRTPREQLEPVFKVYIHRNVVLMKTFIELDQHEVCGAFCADSHMCKFCVSPGQALDALGNTRWRVNKRVLSVVDRIWANGGHLADLVDRNDVSLSVIFFFSLKYFQLMCMPFL